MVVFPLNHLSHLTLSMGVNPFEFSDDPEMAKTREPWCYSSVKSSWF